MSHFLDDYVNATSDASKLYNFIQNGTHTSYDQLLRHPALSVRHALGGIDLTIPYGTLDTNQIRAFLKEIFSDGNVNTADITYATFPIFIS
jgi:hypothetical protein